MYQRSIVFSLIGLMLHIVCLSSCGKVGQIKQTLKKGANQIEIDSASYKFVRNFIHEEKERAKSRSKRKVMNFDTTRPPPLFSYEYFINNEKLSIDEFFEKVDSAYIVHCIRAMDRRKVETSEDNEETLVFSENGHRIFSEYELVTQVNAYSNDFILSRRTDIDHLELHYSKHNVLYLSLGSTLSGYMNAQIYSLKTGEHITSYTSNAFDGSFYIGNGINVNADNGLSPLEKSKKVRVVVMIDDLFSFREFETVDIIEEKDL